MIIKMAATSKPASFSIILPDIIDKGGGMVIETCRVMYGNPWVIELIQAGWFYEEYWVNLYIKQ